MDLPKIDTSNLLDKTYIVLKDRIIRRQFKPNEKLSIPDLCKQLGVSRTPIRDALNRLESDGLVKTVSKVGTFVNAVDIEDVLDSIDTRLMLEFWVADKIAVLPEPELAALISTLTTILDTAASLIETAPFETFLKSDYNLAFHMAFMKAGKNKKNEEIYLNLMNYHVLAQQYSFIKKAMVTTALNQHYAILKALRERRIDLLKEAILLHLDDHKQRLIGNMSDENR